MIIKPTNPLEEINKIPWYLPRHPPAIQQTHKRNQQKTKRTRAAQYSVLNYHSPLSLKIKLNIYKMYIRTKIIYA